MNYKQSSPEVLRQLIRDGELVGHTSGMAEGYIQANVVILPSKYAYDFLKFCFRNPKTCPLLDVSEVGAHSFPYYGPYADIRTDVPKYRIYEHGQLIKEVDDITDLYTEDMVSFLIGCSFTFEHALLEAAYLYVILKRVIMYLCIVLTSLPNQVAILKVTLQLVCVR